MPETGKSDGRAVKDNVTLDQDGVLNERIEVLKRRKRGHIGHLTKIYNELEELREKPENYEEVLKKMNELNFSFVNFQKVHRDMVELVVDKNTTEENQIAYDEQVNRRFRIEDEIKEWLLAVEHMKGVKPKDSVSQIGLKSNYGSNISAHSSKNSLIKARVNHAVARLRLEQIQKEQLILKEELNIKNQMEMMKIKNEIEKSALECEMYEEADRHEDIEEYKEFKSMFKKSEETCVNSVYENQQVPPVNPESNNKTDEKTDFKTEKPTNVEFTSAFENKQYTPNVNARPFCPVSSSNIEVESNSLFTSSHAPTQPTLQAGNTEQLQTSVLKDLGTAMMSMADTLRYGLSKPSPELLYFDGKSTEFSKFIRCFETNLESKTNDPAEKLIYLQQYTRGQAHKLIQNCITLPPEYGFRKAKNLLRERYGQPYMIARAYLDQLIHGPTLKLTDKKGLLELSDLMIDCYDTLNHLGFSSDMNACDNIVKIVKRLPYQWKSQWVMKFSKRSSEEDCFDQASNIEDVAYNFVEPKFKDVMNFIRQKAEALNHPVYSKIMEDSASTKPKGTFKDSERYGTGTRPHATMMNTSVHGSAEDKPRHQNCRYCFKFHKLFECPAFKSKSVETRYIFVRRQGLCLNCLISTDHMSRYCQLDPVCKAEDCRYKSKHHTLLHPLPQRFSRYGTYTTDRKSHAPEFRDGAGHPKENSSSEITACKELVNTTLLRSTSIFLQVVAVRVWNIEQNSVIQTFALLDSGSSACLCEYRLMERLGISTANPEKLSLTTVCGSETQDALKIKLHLSSVEAEDLVELSDVWVVQNSNITKTHCPVKGELLKWSHLKDLPIAEVDINEVTLLIGTNASECFIQYDNRIGEKHAPIAVKTILGWSLMGGRQRTESSEQINFTHMENEKLSKQVEKFWQMDSIGAVRSTKSGMSVEDKRALSIMKNSIQIKDGHYQLDIPWKSSSISLPNNREVAEKRLEMMMYKFRKNEDYYQSYQAAINEYIDSGYALRVPEHRLSNPGRVCWYLPHHGVRHPRKPGKLRVVFDGSAKFKGTSLNDQVLQGPDLTSSLLGVLLRFRQDIIAFTGDIQGMFNQVHVTPKDYDALRFLWIPGEDLSEEFVEFHMKVHLFGGVWSPSCCNFALQQTATDNQDNFDAEIIQSISRNFYVDDLLKSVKDENTAIHMIKSFCELLQKGGFRLTKFLSNSRKVLESVPENDRAKNAVNLDLEDMPMERALGVLWNTELDTLDFKHEIQDKMYTRRGILSIIASIYDPLGHLAVITLQPKRILQKLCRLKQGWDEKIPEALEKEWRKWLSTLSYLQDMRIPRCYYPPEFGRIVSVQMHHFSDASQYGMGTASYLRFRNQNDEFYCCLVLGKSRVTPMKAQSIPRLELNSAVMAVRINQVLLEELELVIQQVFYWTDSTTVLKYIQNESRRFQVYVSNKVSEIHDGSNPEQWFYVDTKLNPGDDASRGIPVSSLCCEHRWFKGPSFLWLSESEWPKQPEIVKTVSSDDPELKKPKSVMVNLTQQETLVDILFKRYSSWRQLKTSVAWLRRYIEYLSQKSKSKNLFSVRKDNLTVTDLREAEQKIIELVQSESFPDEIRSCHGKGNMSQRSSLYKLKPIIDEGGLLCVGGRLERSELSYHQRHQVILPNKHPVTDLIIREMHQTYGHSGRNHILSIIRQRFWIVKGKSAVKRVLADCMMCKRAYAKRGVQLMADLPLCRIKSEEPPFSRIGADLFGPFFVKQGRSTVKRYVCIFTCLQIRAVHFEVLHSLESSSFIEGFRRFISRRGKPLEIRSDRGTNFIGSNKELRQSIAEWNQQTIGQFLLQNQIEWKFNPAAASHHGGVWERLIRSTRNVLRQTLKEQLVNDETFLTVIAEAESILNSRPLDQCSDDPDDLEPLSPNHLLLMRPNDNLPPGVFSKDDSVSNRRWRQAQYLSNLFWKRWSREYIPLLQERQKWLKETVNFKVGDLCLIADNNIARGMWPLARVIKVEPGHDGLVRSVIVNKTSNGEYSRPINKLCLLEGH